MRIRKLLVAAITVLLTFSCIFAVMPASAQAKTPLVSIYLREDGNPVPYEKGMDLSKGYDFKTQGYLQTAEEGYSLQGVEDRLVRVPAVPVGEEETILWYEIVKVNNEWRLHGVAVPAYRLVYDANAEDAQGTTVDNKKYHANSTVQIKDNGYTRSGYEFTGWTTQPDGSGLRFSPDNTFSASELFQVDSSRVLTLYAEWKKVDSTTEPGDGEETGKKISMGIVTPKRMSVRFEDGKIYADGDSIEIEIGKTYRFQMCSNNWETGTYDDNGNGLCGTVVYSVRVSNRYDERSYDETTKTFVLPKGDPVLRTDVNSCFMAYRYHFTKGDYNKQTGIKQVVDTPLESLSVNLPLGSTIQSDAYKGYEQIDSKPVFIERGEDLSLSYTDYYWEY